ncbi:hypothetical protein B0H13DRAFT_1881105 [Mycena leptocephala]|nr:hypothetical protein B0H13DRAFT_1881105 [Mycena leptocephala]
MASSAVVDMTRTVPLLDASYTGSPHGDGYLASDTTDPSGPSAEMLTPLPVFVGGGTAAPVVQQAQQVEPTELVEVVKAMMIDDLISRVWYKMKSAYLAQHDNLALGDKGGFKCVNKGCKAVWQRTIPKTWVCLNLPKCLWGSLSQCRERCEILQEAVRPKKGNLRVWGGARKKKMKLSSQGSWLGPTSATGFPAKDAIKSVSIATGIVDGKVGITMRSGARRSWRGSDSRMWGVSPCGADGSAGAEVWGAEVVGFALAEANGSIAWLAVLQLKGLIRVKPVAKA